MNPPQNNIFQYESFPSQYNFKFDNLQEDACKSLAEALSSSPQENIQKVINAFLNADDTQYDKLFSIGISSVLSFVQCNWTGPFLYTQYFPSLQEQAFKEFSTYEELNENVVNLDLLYLARLIFSNEELCKKFPISVWWSLRINILYEIILDEASTALSQETERLIQLVTDETLLNNDNLKVMFNLELAHYYASKKTPTMSEKYIDIAQSLLKLDMNLEGAMGKRTKFQQEEKPQLFLNVKTGREIVPTKASSNLPKPLSLNDDLRLEKISFSEEKSQTVLGVLEESVIITKYFQLYVSQPRDNLLKEELAPYLEIIIDNTYNWPLKMSALYERCKLEAHHKRTIERSMMQLEHLIEQIKDKTTPVTERVDFFFSSGMKPIWLYKQSLADLMLNIGMVKSALDLYLNLQLWEEVIACYTILELKHKAAEIIQQELAKKRTVKLLCLLGDVTDTEKHYEEAWELSNEKSSRAQRHWGNYYFSKKKYSEAIPHLQKSVELNNIQENVWLKLGFAALDVENWKLAAIAYRRYCELEKGNFEAWNNLAKAYIKLGEKQRAWFCLREAVKYNYDRWEVWDNLMVTSVDLKNFPEVIRCYHRILDLKGNHVDLEVLEILKIYIVDKFNDTTESETENYGEIQRLIENASQFFGRLTSLVTNNSDIWLFYGAITALKDNERASQHLQRAYRTAVSDPRWSNQTDSALKVLDLSIRLAETYLSCAQIGTVKQKNISMLGSAKLSLQAVVSKVTAEQFEDAKLTETLTGVKHKLNIVVSELERIKNLP